jgi:hypothetical protein
LGLIGYICRYDIYNNIVIKRKINALTQFLKQTSVHITGFVISTEKIQIQSVDLQQYKVNKRIKNK